VNLLNVKQYKTFFLDKRFKIHLDLPEAATRLQHQVSAGRTANWQQVIKFNSFIDIVIVMFGLSF
jgi:hypothetical protein